MSPRISLAVAMLAFALSGMSCGGGDAETASMPESTEAAVGSENPLRGVWSVTGTSGGDAALPGLVIFTDSHYSAVYAVGDEPRPLSETAFAPTPEEKAAQYDSIIVNTGTYESDDSGITTRPMLAKSPEFVGGHSTMEYTIEGDVLTLTITSIASAGGDPPPELADTTMTLRRIE